jgi:DNA-binding MarR family transcriptional regulator
MRTDSRQHALRRRLTDRHMQVLAVLYYDGLSSLEYLAAETGFDVPEVQRLCADLMDAGCIERTTIH